MGLKAFIPYAVVRGKSWWMWAECMRFAFVAMIVASVIIGAMG
jgi:hypothetical protein